MGSDDDVISDDQSDHEANVEALQRELEQRKQEVKRLKLEQRARQKEQLKAKERIISQQLHVCHYTCFCYELTLCFVRKCGYY